MPVSKRKRRSISRSVELHSQASPTSHTHTTNQPLIAAPEFRNIHIINHDDTTSVLLPNIHPSFFLPLHSAVHTTCHHLSISASSVECGISFDHSPPRRLGWMPSNNFLFISSPSPHARAPKLLLHNRTPFSSSCSSSSFSCNEAQACCVFSFGRKYQCFSV